MAQTGKLMNRIINILLVDDDNLDQIDVTRTLDRKNIVYRLKTAKNGEEALARLRDTDDALFGGIPDIILLDLNMPKMDGFEVLQHIKENEDWKSIKVFILTTTGENDDKRRALALGASGFITKPLKFESNASMDAFNLMIDLMNLQG
jgi:CheY-like chemotaxis protein